MTNILNIQRQVDYWRDNAIEDWQVAHDLVNQGRIRHGLFFAHLGLEKLLKAAVCQHTQDLAPRLHNLVRLAELTGLPLNEAQIDILAEMNVFNIEGRYPDMLQTPPSIEEARYYLNRAMEVYEWLMMQLSNPSAATYAP